MVSVTKTQHAVHKCYLPQENIVYSQDLTFWHFWHIGHASEFCVRVSHSCDAVWVVVHTETSGVRIKVT
ncbi:hypothetical protein FGIG_12354 [Fasciola gigantica]|uniref:Uncharacterized protein n=1 Tax=Fasciola gigantica TaxID=46835 RepID=A0A504YJM3_FASGI|nr:hypothetical protein FGIG_12354 [Fasciola gigantica]